MKLYIIKYGCIKPIKYDNYKKGDKGLLIDGLRTLITFTAEGYDDDTLTASEVRCLDGESVSGIWHLNKKRKEVKR